MNFEAFLCCVCSKHEIHEAENLLFSVQDKECTHKMIGDNARGKLHPLSQTFFLHISRIHKRQAYKIFLKLNSSLLGNRGRSSTMFRMVNCQYWQTDIFDTQNGLGDLLVYMAAQCHVTMSYIIQWTTDYHCCIKIVREGPRH